jgi:hypothetical protein
VFFNVFNEPLFSKSPRIHLVTLGVGHYPPPDIYCAYRSDEPPPNLLIVGEYTCSTTVQPVQLLSEGTLNLVPAHFEYHERG